MNSTEVLGYVASTLVLATFCMRDMAALRLLAIASNLAFIVYAALSAIHPGLLLHALLLPMNVCRLLQAMQRRDGAHGPARGQQPQPGDTT